MSALHVDRLAPLGPNCFRAVYFSRPVAALMVGEEMMRTAAIDTRLLDLRTRFVMSLPGRVFAIAQTLQQRQGTDEDGSTLDRQFHNLAGTAGTFGLFAIAAAASDGYDECSGLNGAQIEGDACYLWSIVEELANEALNPQELEPSETFFSAPNPAGADDNRRGGE